MVLYERTWAKRRATTVLFDVSARQGWSYDDVEVTPSTMAERGQWDCVGVARDTYKAQQKEREERPKQQPWLVRKLVVGVVIGIVGWTYYVYVGRMCVELIRRGEKAKGGE